MQFLSREKKKINRLVVAAIFILAAFVRMYHFNTWSLSNDELSAIARLHFLSFDDLIQYGVMPDFHPAGVQVFLFYYVKIFGESVTAIRLPFVLAGIVSVILLFIISRKWFGETTALFATASIAFLEFPILYSQIARPYSFGLLLILLSTIVFDRIVFSDKTKHLWLYTSLLALLLGMLMYNHYYSFLTAGFLGLGFLIYCPKNRIKYLLLAASGAIITFLPHINVTLFHLSKGGVENWLAKPDNTWLLKHVLYVFNDSWWLLAVVLLSVVLLFQKKTKPSKYLFICLIVFFGTFLTGFLYSKYVSAIIQHSTMLFALPFLLMLLFSFSGKKSMSMIVLIGYGMLLMISSFGINKYFQKQHFGEFKEISHTLVKWNKEYKKEILNVCSVNDIDYFNYYFNDDTVGFSITQIDDKKQLSTLANIIANSGAKYISLAITKPYNHQAIDIITAAYPYQYYSKDYSGLSEIYLFAKDSSDDKRRFSVFNTSVKKKIFEDFEHSSLRSGIKYDDKDIVCDSLGKRCLYINTNKVYSLNYIIYAEKESINGVTINFDFKSEKRIKNMLFVVSIEGGEKKFWKAMPLNYFQRNNCWNNFKMEQIIEERQITEKDNVKLYLWNPHQEEVQIDNIRILVY